MSAPPKRGPGAPRKERPKRHLTIRVDEDQLALARHLFSCRTDSAAIGAALDYANANAGEYLTPEMRARILSAARQG